MSSSTLLSLSPPGESAQFVPAPVAVAEAEEVYKGDLVVGGELHAHDLVGSAVEVPECTHLVVRPCHSGTLFRLQGTTRVDLPVVWNPEMPLLFEFLAGAAKVTLALPKISFECTNGHEFASSSCVRVSTCGNATPVDGAAKASGECQAHQHLRTFVLFPGATDASDAGASDAGASDDARPLLYRATSNTFSFAGVQWLQLRVQTARVTDGRVRLRLTGHVGIQYQAGV